MRIIVSTFFTSLLILTAATLVSAEDKAQIVSSTVISNQPPRVCGTDLVRFNNHWYLAYDDSVDQGSMNSAIRVVRSADGVEWKSETVLKSQTPNRGLYRPRFTVLSDDQLMVTTTGVVPNPNAETPVPEYGGTINTMAWFTGNGRSWGETDQIGKNDFPFSRVVRHGESAFSYASGCICGNAQTIHIFSSTNRHHFESLYEETFQGFFPDEAALLFDGDQGYCLMSRTDGNFVDDGVLGGYFGISKAPFTEWKWQEIDARIKYPNLLQLPDKRIIASVGIVDQKNRISLCELDPATGNLTELLEIPSGGNLMPIGLASDRGDVWVSYQADHEGTLSVYLAQVKLD
ncbi:hypothetical protein [Stieleria varia]|uniref:Sialidase domain-containing protein n=1 Tax=Stieleria varia TaxID=2528005 RepID=A0A5C6B1C9_9BACT|nr:hypothetical protein [Stieleria varia]TWU05993.1 hypothetical protein Pla52n_17090 [Stieleria varia]